MAYRCSSGLVLSVVIILLALEYSSAKCHAGNLGTETKGQSGSKTGKDVFLQSDTMFLWGRKMLQELDGKPVYIPGKSKPADLDNSFPELQTENYRVQAQNKGEMFRQKGSRFPSGVDEQQLSQKSMAQATRTSSDNENVVDKHDYYITKKNDESKAFLEAADEVANLMRKDYKGGDRPRRKPPINNHEPKD